MDQQLHGCQSLPPSRRRRLHQRTVERADTVKWQRRALAPLPLAIAIAAPQPPHCPEIQFCVGSFSVRSWAGTSPCAAFLAASSATPRPSAPEWHCHRPLPTGKPIASPPADPQRRGRYPPVLNTLAAHGARNTRPALPANKRRPGHRNPLRSNARSQPLT